MVSAQLSRDGTVYLRFEYAYDALGRLVRVTDARGQSVLQSYDAAGNVTAVAFTAGGLSFTVSYGYDAWGNILEASGPLAQVNPYRHAGYRWDRSTGLYFLQARYYNPEAGRFISRDTILGAPKASQTLKLDAYGNNNPVNFTEPAGRWSWSKTNRYPVTLAVLQLPSRSGWWSWVQPRWW
ncbi:MAG: RHS repeat-associated core domain-containing protein [Bacillota bacterium]|nr:RHS repeat-associated core domain-containing protein [Bacillota bacterium]